MNQSSKEVGRRCTHQKRLIEVAKTLRQILNESIRVTKHVETEHNHVSLLQSLRLEMVCDVVDELVVIREKPVSFETVQSIDRTNGQNIV